MRELIFINSTPYPSPLPPGSPPKSRANLAHLQDGDAENHAPTTMGERIPLNIDFVL